MNTLQNHKNKPLFEVPEHYFEQLQYDVMQHVTKKENKQKRTQKWISAVSVAASLTLIFMLSYFLFVNRNFDEHFYVHQENVPQEDTVVPQNSKNLAETIEGSTVNTENSETLSPQALLVAEKETIVYRAVDFYVDDYETYNFCEVMYDLECYFDY